MKSDLQLKARDKLVQKMTRDGAVEENLGAKTQKKISRRIAEESLGKETLAEEKVEPGKGAENPTSRFQAYKKQIVYRATKTTESNLQETTEKEARPHSTQFIRDSTGSGNAKAEKTLKTDPVHKHKLHKKQTQQFSKKQKLHFEEAVGERLAEVAKAEIRNKDAENSDENVAVEAVQGSETAVEHGVKEYSRHKNRTAYKKQKQKASHLLHEEPVTKRSNSATFRESRQNNPYFYGKSSFQSKRLKNRPVQAEAGSIRMENRKSGSSALYMESRASKGKYEPVNVQVQKKAQAKLNRKNRLKKDYAAAFRANTSESRYTPKTMVSGVAKAIGQTGGKLKDFLTEIISRKKSVVAIAVAVGIAVISMFSGMSQVGAIVAQSGRAFVESTYLSSDDDIKNADVDYEAKEERLQEQIDHIESDYPGYDEYRYQVDEISHDPYALTSYLTAKFGNYKRGDVAEELDSLFQQQYTLSLEESMEIRTRTETRTETHTDPVTGETETEEYEVEVEYEYWILTVTLTNKGVDAIVRDKLGDNQKMYYSAYLSTKGNRSYLFGTDTPSGNVSGGGMSYDVPPEALEDEAFARMLAEGEKYLGRAYVWGGSNPTTGFDCSGFICWIINHSGNGWNVGRTTAEGLRSACTYVSPSEAKPGDLIFFQGTYNTTGASHVGLYVGNGVMLHCGNPIQYSSINSAYWQQHFMSFGRIHG